MLKVSRHSLQINRQRSFRFNHGPQITTLSTCNIDLIQRIHYERTWCHYNLIRLSLDRIPLKKEAILCSSIDSVSW
jgi:hypothetical protein